MKLLIHDLPPETAARLLPGRPEDKGWLVFDDDGTIHNCIGCFGCWIKTPGACVIRDRYGDMGQCLARCDELAIMSRCCYGGPSPFVKEVLDRCIPYIHPYFVMKGGEMHHRQRYERTFDARACFYGPGLTRGERATAEKWVHAMADNLYCDVKQVLFQEEPAEWEGLA